MVPTKRSRVFLRAAAIAGLAVLALLVLVPCMALFLAATPESASQQFLLSKLPVPWWAGWAVFSLWATLDSSTLLRMLGKSVDPLGTYALGSMLLGALNIGTSSLVVMLQTHR